MTFQKHQRASTVCVWEIVTAQNGHTWVFVFKDKYVLNCFAGSMSSKALAQGSIKMLILQQFAKPDDLKCTELIHLKRQLDYCVYKN